MLEEAAMLHSLSHPNVVRLLGVNKTDMPCLVMELLNGGSLFDLLHGVPEGTPPLPLNWSLSFLKDVAEAIEYLHSLPMAHRDLKSQNIMMRIIGGDGLYLFLELVAEAIGDPSRVADHVAPLQAQRTQGSD